MSQTQRKKIEADKLLESVAQKAHGNPREIQLKGYHIASVYVQAKEYKKALQFAQNYVSIKPDDVRAHRLLGEIYEALKNVQKAIESYRRSLELDKTQKNLVLKVAELYCLVEFEPDKHRFWAERAEKLFPGHPKIYEIMEYVYRKSGKLDKFQTYLRQKLKSHPSDLGLNLQLLKVLTMLPKLKEAQELCLQVEGARLFDHETQWWEQTIELYQELLGNVNEGEHSILLMNTFSHLLISLNKLVIISLATPTTPVAHSAMILKQMDVEMLRATDYISASQPSLAQQLAANVNQEMKAQLYTHLATLITKMTATNVARWPDVVGMVTACYLVSANVPPCRESMITSTSRGQKDSINSPLYSMSHCRLSEVCHILNSIVKQQKQSNWLKHCHGNWCSQEGQQQLINQAFGNQGVDPASSFLNMDDSLLNVKGYELPSLIKTVLTYDQESVKTEPQSLQRLIWLGLQWDLRPDGILPDLGNFLQLIFPRLLFSTQRLENTSVDNIRLLDIEVFLYCCVHVAKAQQEHLQARVQASHSLPKTLPLGLCRGWCSQQQLDWYSALCRLYTAKASSNERANLRLTVQRGLEVMRCRTNHGMETALLIRLGRTFRKRMQEVKDISKGDENREQWNAFQQMSVMYWQAALEHLHMLARNQAVPKQQRPFFPYSGKLIQVSEIQVHQDDGTVAVAEYKFQQGQFQQAVTMLDRIKSAEGLFLKAQMYLMKSQMESKELDVSLNCSLLSRQGDLLDKAKDALFDTMDSIQHQPDHPLHEEVQKNLTEIDEQQAALSIKVAELQQEQEVACDNSLNALDDSRNVSTFSDIAPLQPPRNDPSPRRLASELRSLNVSHGRLMEENTQLRSLATTHSRILEQNQMLIEKQNLLMESNNALMKQVLELNTKFQELSTAQAKAPPPQQQVLPDSINSSRPIIITASQCKVENPNLSAQLGASIHPMMAHGVASPMHANPAQMQAMYQQPYAYYNPYGMVSYEHPGMQPNLMTSTPTMHASQVSNTQPYLHGYEGDPTSPTDNEAEGGLGMEGGSIRQEQATTMPEMQPETPQAANFHQGLQDGIQSLASSMFINGVSSNQRSKETQETGSLGSMPGPQQKFTFSDTPSASGQDVSSSSPLLMNMLKQNKCDDPGAGGSITTGTPPQSASSSASSAFKHQTETSSQHGYFSGLQSPQIGLFQTPSSQDSASVFGTTKTAANETSILASSGASVFPNPSQPTSTGIPQSNLSPVTPDVTASLSSQDPLAGYAFGQIKPPESKPIFDKFKSSPSKTLSFGSIPQQVSVSKKEEDDDVIFISEKLPTADQRAKAERLLLPPTFFLYEDDPPCPGCRGCEEEDLAHRGIQLSKLPLAAGKSAVVTPAAVFGSAAGGQKTFGSVAGDTPSTFEAQDCSQGAFSNFGNAGQSLSFASLSSDKQGSFAGKGKTGFGFAQAGAQVFGGGGDDTAGGDEEHDPHYDPIVPLPELVDTKTGEEDEEIMYKQRARLYRFAKELNVWKERGVGEVKLMRHKESGALRLLMRREQVLKLCANHRITHDIKLEILKTSDRTWVWHALDYSEDEPCHEQFAIKFKTPELAVEFKQRFEELQAERTRELKAEKEDEAVVPEVPRGDQPEKDDDVDKKDGQDDVAAEATVPNAEPTTEELIAKYQPKPGSWQCDACWVNNEETALTCVSCTTPKPGAAAPSATQQLSTLSKLAGASRQNQSVPSSGSEFTFSSGGGFSFAGMQASDNASKPSGFGSFGQTSTFSKTPSDTTLIVGGPMQFGSSSSDTKLMAPSEKPVTTPTGKFSFGGVFQKYDLGAAGDQSKQAVTTATSPSAGFSFCATSITPPKSDPVTAASSKSQTQPLTPVKQDQHKEALPTEEKTGFVFGAGSLSSQTPKSSAPPAQSMGFSFSDMAKTKGSLFSFRMDVSKTPKEAPQKSPIKPKSPAVVKSPHQPQSPGLNKSGDGDYYKDDDGDHIHFDPIVYLPECIEARTGEEGEEVKFSHRAKLFRYNKESTQWKERGIGDIKVLFNPDNKKYRIVMRREQVLKVCANHFVTPELKLQPHSGSTKSWVWMAMDASEDETQMEQLAVRFKTEELAQQFKEAVEAAQEDIETGGEGNEVEIKDKGKKEGKKETEEAEKENKDIEGDVKEDDGEADEEETACEEDYEDVDDHDVDDDEKEDEDGNGNEQGEDEEDATTHDDQQGEDEQEAKLPLDQQGEDKQEAKLPVDQQGEDEQEAKLPVDQQGEDEQEAKLPVDQQGEDKQEAKLPVDQQGEDKQEAKLPVDQQGENKQEAKLPVDQQGENKQEVKLPVDQQGENKQEVKLPVDQQGEDEEDATTHDDQQGEDEQEAKLPVDQQGEDKQEAKLPVDQQGEDKQEAKLPVDQQGENKQEAKLPVDQQGENKQEAKLPVDQQGEDKQDATTHSDEQVEDKQEAKLQGDQQGEDEQEDSTAQGDDKSTVKSCDPSISQAFSDLLRNANANHAQKQKEMTLAESSPGDEEAAGGSKDDSVSEERDDIHFDPIVQLPEQLEKITGEEDENQLFCSRSKLYRFDKTSSQWKDRGIGDIKILQNVKTRRYRILMRREQVFRVCANHIITKDMALHPNAGSENSLVWHAMDASDGDPQPEQLAVRFKLAGTAQRFKTTFEECQAELRKLDDIGTEQADEVSSTTEEPTKSPAEGQDGGDVVADKKPSTSASSLAEDTDTTPSSSATASTSDQGSN